MWYRYASAVCAAAAGILTAVLILRDSTSFFGICALALLLVVSVLLLFLAPHVSRTMEAVDVLKLQLDDLTAGSTRVAYQLASPANRRTTASDGNGGNHNARAFDKMVRTGFAPMLDADDYAISPVAGRGGTSAAYDVLLFASGKPTAAYRFELSTVQEADAHASLGAFALPPNSHFWRTDAAIPLSDVDAVVDAVHARRQHEMRARCFGSQADHDSVAHSFGTDDTHNLCCALGPAAKAYADVSGNPIGSAAERIDVVGSKSVSNWSTCMGSNVCSAYAEQHRDGTTPLFATNRALTKVVTDVPADVDCEAYAARLLTAQPHSTPGIHTRGDPERCAHKDRVNAGLLSRQRDVDNWLSWPTQP